MSRRILVTGAGGLLGWHSASRLHAANCAARFRKEAVPYDIVAPNHGAFEDDAQLVAAVSGADAILHFAGVNRGTEAEVGDGNPAIAQRLVDACKRLGSRPHVTYANSTHAKLDTVYGNSKRLAGELLAGIGGGFTDLILPHIFGEGARPRYNNVTATFIEAVINGESPHIDPNGRVQLLHAGAAAQIAIDAALARHDGELAPAPRPTDVPWLFETLQRFHADYAANLFPDLADPFLRDLFNSYRAALYPAGFPRSLKVNADPRGTLFEAAKGGGGGQTFLSWTEPGVTRGDHFHLGKVERFLVLEGEAMIRIRKVLGGPVWEYQVSGKSPAPVDMPTLHTHSIQNIGDRPLLTLFWTNDLFDPAAPDTYFDPVLQD
jgi:UDP-2-acetamido-2,6-beta-L-arabino-hexul-4-ose reductase